EDHAGRHQYPPLGDHSPDMADVRAIDNLHLEGVEACSSLVRDHALPPWAATAGTARAFARVAPEATIVAASRTRYSFTGPPKPKMSKTKVRKSQETFAASRAASSDRS